MPRSDWSRFDKAITAFAIIAGIALYWWMFFDMGWQSGRNQERTAIETKHYAADTDRRIERECTGPIQATARECIADIIRSERESQRNESDLAAQWQAANWAFWAAIIGGAQFLATLTGLYYIKGTLDATLEAVEDTGKATAAMEKANTIAEKARISSEQQLRAYVSIVSIQVSNLLPGQIPKFHVGYTNRGQTAADRTMIKSSLAISEHPPRFTGMFFNKFKDVGPLGAGDNKHHSLEWKNSTPGQFDMLMRKEATFLFGGVIKYRDIFKRRHYTTFFAKLNVSELVDGHCKLHIVERGNVAS